MGGQRTFASMAWNAKGKVTRREQFLTEIEFNLLFCTINGCGYRTMACLKVSFQSSPTSLGRYPRDRRVAQAMLIVVLFASPRAVAAQQRGVVPLPLVTQNQRASLPGLPTTTPSSQAGNNSLSVPDLRPQPGQELELPPRPLPSQLGYEQVTVTVTDQAGRYVAGLRESDFRLYVDGARWPVQYVRQDFSTSVLIAIVAGTPGSMESKRMQLRAAIAQLIRALSSRDDLLVLTVSDRIFLQQSFAIDHYSVRRAALFDIVDGLIMVQNGRYDKKVLLMMADGKDNVDRVTLVRVIEQARRISVLIYSTEVGDPRLGLFGPSIWIEQDVMQRLAELSSETGTYSFLVHEVGDGELLRQNSEAISDELRAQYAVGFAAPDPLRPGDHGVSVEVSGKPELLVRVRSPGN
jgi:hypothetical protein